MSKNEEKKKDKINKTTNKTENKTSTSKKEIRDLKQKKLQNKKFVKGLIATFIILVVSSCLLYPMITNTKFGLDLKGGFEILYEVQDINGKEPSKESVTNTYKTILKRIDILGVSEPEITIEGNNIRVQLAGVKDDKEAKRTLSSMANLTFRNSKDELVMSSDVLKANGVKVRADEQNVGNYYLTLDIKDVKTFHEKTEEIRKSGDVMVIWLDYDEEVDTFKKEQQKCGTLGDSRCISYASIIDELTTDTVTLSGNFTQEEAQNLADLINSGSLPTKLVELSSKTVDASFGKDALQNTFIAGVVAVALICLCLIFIYHFSGFIATVGVITYTMLVFAIFNLIGGRLTLPSIAAVVIGIGMAVDSAVLSFERIKEELKKNKSLDKAFIEGNKSSLVSIIDSNITTLIAAIILFMFGESSVKGFATMLIISIVVTLFVMVLLIRVLLKNAVESKKFEEKYNLFIGLKDLNKNSFVTKLDYVKHRFVYMGLSVAIIVIGAICTYQNGLNLSIDFKGGTSITLNSSETLKETEVKKQLESLGYEVKEIDSISDNSVYVTLNNVFVNEDNDKVNNYFEKEYKDATTSIGAVSNTVKKELVNNAIRSLLYATIGIIIYITLRFTFRYGISAIIALLHDALMVIMIFSIFKLEISTIFIAAILSIIGYSINDTIVTFDRIRENKKKLYKDKIKNYDELKHLVNTSIRETVTRSIITSITTLIPVICLLILGSSEIATFNYALLIGLIAGTYSSIFIASQIWLMFERRNIGKPEKKKWYEVDDKDEIEELKVKGINC